ncbi:MAG: hypothetical protein GX638_13725, partial [Crenarchaeota archaeon]|nr:hypothetical protein [Thermoproteota archaeon]
MGTNEKDNKEVIDFAKLLCCGVNFDETSVIRASRKLIAPNEDVIDIPIIIYKEIQDYINKSYPSKEVYKILKEKGINIPFVDDLRELLFYLIQHDSNYYLIKDYLKNNPETVNKISKDLDFSIDDLGSFVMVASKAIKNNESIFEARYHMFIRAIEGVYITLKPHKKLYFGPMETVVEGDVKYQAFELSVCQNCGEMFIVGYIDENGILQQLKRGKEIEDQKKEYFMISIENYCDEETEDDFEITVDDELFYLCSLCGAISRVTSHQGKSCKCGDKYLNQVKRIIPKNQTLHKCPSCSFVDNKSSVLRDFYIGQEAAASVLGTSLYEELPSYEIKREIVNNVDLDEDDEFGNYNYTSLRIHEWENRLAKQFLAFSDSRQEAAYFSSYFDFTYNNILRKRLMVEILNRNTDKISINGWNIERFVRELMFLFNEYKIFKDEDEREREAWKTILYEVCNNNARFGLEGLGILSFQFIPVKYKLNDFTEEEGATLQKILANSFRNNGKVVYPYNLTETDKEYFLYKACDNYMALKPDGNLKYIRSWCSRGNKSNLRVNYIEKITSWDKEKANRLLEYLWKRIYNHSENSILTACDGDKYKINLSKFKVKNGLNSNIKWYKCSKCHKITPHNIRNICPEYMCNGLLFEYNIAKEFKDNHYRELYLNLDISPLVIKEHTAQLSSETARDYQERFVRKEINILSCSTTFEMG